MAVCEHSADFQSMRKNKKVNKINTKERESILVVQQETETKQKKLSLF